MKKRVASLTALNVASMLASLGIQVVTAIYLGAGWERDALFVAMSVPVFLNSLLVSTIGVMVTPAVISSCSIGEQHQKATAVMISLALATAIVAGLIYLARARCVSLLAPGFTATDQAFTGRLLTVAAAIIPVQATACVASGYFVARDRVLLPAFALALGNTLTLASLVLMGASLSAESVILASLLGASLTLGIQLAVFIKERLMKRLPGPVNLPNPGSVYRRALPLVFSGLVSRSSPLIERHFASSLETGSISCLGYAGYLVNFLVNATSGPIATASYAKICQLWNVGNREEAGRILEKNLQHVLGASLAVAGLVVLVGGDGFRLLLRSTKFTPAEIEHLAIYCDILMTSYVFLACGGLISRLFYAAGRSLKISMLECTGAVFYVVTAYWLSHVLEAKGLAIAASLNSVVVVSLFLLWAYRQFRSCLRREFALRLRSLVLRWGLAFMAAITGKYCILQSLPVGFASGTLIVLLYIGALAVVTHLAIRSRNFHGLRA